MDITGYRSSGSLMQASVGAPPRYNAQRRRGSLRQGGVPVAAKALLLLGLLALVWAGVRHAGRWQSSAASKEGDSGAGWDAEADHVITGSKQGQAGGGSGHRAHRAAVLPSLNSTRSEELAQARIERAMRLAPMYRGPGKSETFPFFGNANRVLLASHGRLMWYRYDTDELKVVAEGKGEHLFYGVFAGAERGLLGEPTSVWAVAAPFDWQAEALEGGSRSVPANKEWLLHLDLESGAELGRVQLPSRFSHDAVRRRDRVYAADTARGSVLELSFPGLELLRTLPLFTPKEHVNTLAPTADGKLWAVLHGTGGSELAQVDLKSGKLAARHGGVGHKAHGLVFWQDKALTLDSEGTALLLVDTGKAGQGGGVERLWQAPDKGKHLRGLCVVDDVAFFGIAPATRQTRRADESLHCELAAFDLQQRVLLWRRQLPTHGLINTVSAPHLTVESTTYAVNTRPLISYRDKPEFDAALDAAKRWALQQEREAQGAHGAQAVQQQEAQQAEHVQAAQQVTQQAQQEAQQTQQGEGSQGAQQGAQVAQQAQQAQQAEHETHQEDQQQQHTAEQAQHVVETALDTQAHGATQKL